MPKGQMPWNCMPQREYAFWLYASKGFCLMTVCPRGTMPYNCMPRREMPFDRMPKYRGAKITLCKIIFPQKNLSVHVSVEFMWHLRPSNLLVCPQKVTQAIKKYFIKQMPCPSIFVQSKIRIFPDKKFCPWLKVHVCLWKGYSLRPKLWTKCCIVK